MYAIAQVIYGIPVSDVSRMSGDLAEFIGDSVDNDEDGFLSYYSGGANRPPQAIGVGLDKFLS